VARSRECGVRCTASWMTCGSPGTLCWSAPELLVASQLCTAALSEGRVCGLRASRGVTRVGQPLYITLYNTLYELPYKVWAQP
jgi:hypothetical protein